MINTKFTVLIALCFCCLQACTVHEVRNDPEGREVILLLEFSHDYVVANKAIYETPSFTLWPTTYYVFTLEEPGVSEPIIVQEVEGLFFTEAMRIPVTTRAKAVVARIQRALLGEMKASSQPVTINLPEGPCTIFAGYDAIREPYPGIPRETIGVVQIAAPQ